MKQIKKDVDFGGYVRHPAKSDGPHLSSSSELERRSAAWRMKQYHVKWHIDCQKAMQLKLDRTVSSLESRIPRQSQGPVNEPWEVARSSH